MIFNNTPTVRWFNNTRRSEEAMFHVSRNNPRVVIYSRQLRSIHKMIRGYHHVIVVLLIQIAGCHSAGMTAHNVAARRASQYEYFGPKTDLFDPKAFYSLAKDRSDSIQAGSPFPDFLYACGDEHDAGEEAHWTPFQIASVNYIRDKYPDWSSQNRSDDGPGLVAFIMGVTSHYIADINWHGLEVIPAGEGLIRTMGYADFNCTDGSLCSEAHTAADTGGEFVAAATMDLDWLPLDSWFVPTDDLVNIYASLNASGEGPLVEPQWINECCFGVSRFGDLLYPLLAPKLGGVLLEQYFDFPVGGIDDDAAWTSFMWNRLADWLVYGPPPDDPPPNLQAKLRQAPRHLEQKAKRSYIASVRRILSEESEVFFMENENGGTRVGLKGSLTKLPEALLLKLGEALLKDYVYVLYPELNDPKDVLSFSAKRYMEKLKSRVADINDTPKKSSMENVIVSNGASQHEYFGSSLTFVKDQSSILVGSPGGGVLGAPQQGFATLLFDESQGVDKSLLIEGGNGVDSGSTLQAKPSYERFGWASCSCDVNGDGVEDLVICAPSYNGGRNTTEARGNYTGRCDIFYGPFSPSQVQKLNPSMSIYGDKEWGNFGYAISSGDLDNDGKCDLVISAPFAGSYEKVAPDDLGDVSSQGAVYIFLGASLSKSYALRVDATASSDLILQPEGAYQWFGKSVEVVLNVDNTQKHMLLIGAPVFHSTVMGDERSAVGRVYAFEWQGIKGGSQEHLFSITGCWHASVLGHAVASSADFFALSETGWNVTTEESEILRAGRVHIIPWKDALQKLVAPAIDFPICDLGKSMSASTFEGQSFEGRYGSALVFQDNNTLVVGAPLANNGRGYVSRIDVLSSTEEVLFSPPETSELGKSRVGQALAISNNNIFVGAPFADTTIGEQVGALLSV